MNPILECRGLTKKYKNTLAINELNTSIEPGQIVGLLGPNGSGKTTLIKLANGLLSPTQGEILIDGKKPGFESKSIVSYLPDRTYFNEWMTIENCLELFKDFYTDFSENTAHDMLRNLGLNPKLTFRQLSKGMKEKVQLVLVMSRKAKLYLLDEPIGGVDPASRDYILSTIIRNYNEEGTVIISTHLIQDIEKVLDEVIFLDKGHIVKQGNVDEIRSQEGESIDAIFREVFKC